MLIFKILVEISILIRVMAGDIEFLIFLEDGIFVFCVMMFIYFMVFFYVYRGTDFEKVMKEVAEICVKD